MGKHRTSTLEHAHYSRTRPYVYTQEDARLLHQQVCVLIAHIQSLLLAHRYPEYVDMERAIGRATAAWESANEIQLKFYPLQKGERDGTS